jgi:TolB protein
VICADGSHERRLTTTPDIQERSPAFSPDGRWLAFAGENRDHVLDLYLMRPDGTQRRNLTADLDCGAEYPSWSPDGTRIAFASDRGRREQSYQIYVMRSDGSAVRQITRGTASHFNPAWQPVRAAR